MHGIISEPKIIVSPEYRGKSNTIWFADLLFKLTISNLNKYRLFLKCN